MKKLTYVHVAPRYSLLTLGLLVVTAPVFAQGKARSIPAAPLIPNSDGAAPTSPAAAVAATGAETPAPANAALDPQIKARLDKVIDRYRTLKSYSVTVEKGGRKQLIEFSAPQNLKFTSLDEKGNVRIQQIYTSTEIISTQKPNDVLEWSASPLKATEGDPRTQLSNVGGLFISSFIAGVNPFEGKRYLAASLSLGKPQTYNDVAVTPIIVNIAKTPQFRLEQIVTLFVSDDNLIQGIKTDIVLPNGQLNSTVENYSKVQADIELPASNFVFTPPTGAVKVNAFTRANLRATVGQAPQSLGTQVKDLTGKEISFDQYKGKVVLVDFWATWCGPCKAELPNVKANYQKYKDQGFDVIGISLDRSTEPLTKYIADNDLPWRQIFDGQGGAIANAFNVRAIPSTLIIGKDGKVTSIGARGDKLEPAIQAALKAAAPAN